MATGTEDGKLRILDAASGRLQWEVRTEAGLGKACLSFVNLKRFRMFLQIVWSLRSAFGEIDGVSQSRRVQDR